MNVSRIVIRPLLVLVGLGTALTIGDPAASSGGGPSILGGVYGPVGVTGPPESPAADLRYATLNSGRKTLVQAIDTDGGEIRKHELVDGRWELPAVTLAGEPGGLSADGRTLVLIRPSYLQRPPETKFLVLDTKRLQASRAISLDGPFSFDAISPDGRLMYLVHYRSPVEPTRYRVRVYDLASGELRPGEVVDPSEPDERMTGQPVDRATSPDGRWAYTLYGGGAETFVHALDTQEATAVCVDLPQLDAEDFFRLGLGVAPATGAITVLRRGDATATIDPQTFEVSPVTETTAVDTDDSGPGLWTWAAYGAALGLCLAALLMLLRRRRAQITAADLERALRADDRVAPPEDARDREPVA